MTANGVKLHAKSVHISKEVNIAQENIKELFSSPLSEEIEPEKDSIISPSKIVFNQNKHIPQKIFLLAVVSAIICWTINYHFLLFGKRILDKYSIPYDRLYAIQRISLLSVLLFTKVSCFY